MIETELMKIFVPGYILLAGVLLTASLLACSNANNPSISNFESVLRHVASNHNEDACFYSSIPAGANVPLSAAEWDHTRHALAALEAGGALKMTVNNPGDGSIYYVDLELTPSAREHARVSGDRATLCYGTIVLDRVTNYALSDGNNIAEVQYTCRYDGVAPWANDPDVRSFFPETMQGCLREYSIVLRLTHNGWEVSPNQVASQSPLHLESSP